MSTAISSFQANLMKGTTSGGSTTWARICEIKSFPDLGAAPEQLDKTTTADPQRTYIEGIQANEAKTFKFVGKGYVSVFVNGGNVNEVVNMTITLTMTKGFVKAAS